MRRLFVMTALAVAACFALSPATVSAAAFDLNLSAGTPPPISADALPIIALHVMSPAEPAAFTLNSDHRAARINERMPELSVLTAQPVGIFARIDAIPKTLS